METDGVDEMQLLSCGQETLLCMRPGGVDALSWGDGSILWSYDNAFIAENTGVLSDDGGYLAVLDWRLSGNLEKYEYYLLVLSTEDGQEVSKLKLTEGAQFVATEELPYVQFEGVLGDFSDDGGTFAGVYSWEDDSETQYITYYRADLADGTVHNRLYLTDTSSASDPGLCLDMGSWTVLAEISGLLCYDSVQDRIFFYQRSTQTVLSSCLPSTQQLVDCWQQVTE